MILLKLDGVGPVDNRPSTAKLYHSVPPQKNTKKMSSKKMDKVVKLVGGGSVINRAYPV